MSELREAFREAARREFLEVPAEWELDYVFSPRFERRMRRLINANTYGYWRLVNTAAKRVAIAAALIVMLLSTAMAIKPVRERVIQFFIEVYEEYFEIRFGEEVKNDLDPMPKPMERYTLTKIPHGYEEVECIETEQMIWTSWKNKNGYGISLQQEPGTHEITLNNAAGKNTMIKHGDRTITYQTLAEVRIFVWEQDDYIFYLSLAEDLSVEEILEIIESLEKKE